MKKIILLVSIVLLMGAGCVEREVNIERSQLACIDKGGIPMVNNFGDMTDCKFPPEGFEDCGNKPSNLDKYNSDKY